MGKTLRSPVDAILQWSDEHLAEIEQAQKVMQNRDATKEARREALKTIQAYQPGDLLEVIAGPLAGQIAAFSAMVERGASLTPEIAAEWGAIPLRLDPLAVRKVG
jgi:transcription antitermination factor NusG